MKNLRKSERQNCLVPVEGKEDGLFAGVRTFDFSKGGVGFISPNAIPVDSKIAIEIDLDEFGEPVLVIGKVKWVNSISGTSQYRIGMAFDEVLPGSKSRLNNFFVEK